MLQQRSYVHLKVATTLDGRIATASGDAKWISSELARDEVHTMRCEYDAVLIGRNTLELDDPELTVRRVECSRKVPWRIILGDPKKMSFEHKLFQMKPEKIILEQREEGLSQFTQLPFKDWSSFLKETAKLGITSILVEGGAQVASSLLLSGIVDELSIYMSPKLIGNGPTFFSDSTRNLMEQAIKLEDISVRNIGSDVVWHWQRGK
jgi:diaminohydroxyphosphoribosylaminopyrimidine deaminase/5-amino-6-(5-phosphoribosylamino)uracil reductase